MNRFVFGKPMNLKKEDACQMTDRYKKNKIIRLLYVLIIFVFSPVFSLIVELIGLGKKYIMFLIDNQHRDILFVEYVRSECEKNDIPCIINDGLISKDEMFEKVKKLFGL